jgi:hypothetical protein
MIQVQKPFDDLMTDVAGWLERRSRLLSFAILVYMLLAAIGIASREILWSDELITALTSLMPSFSAIWRFYASGYGNTAPMQSLVGHLGVMLPLPTEISVRLPFILAYLCMCLGIYAFVRRRYPAGYALAALAMPVVLPNLYSFMTYARAYTLELGAAGIALYCWQKASEGEARPWTVFGIWLSLAAATAGHVYSVFLFVPFAAAQAVHDKSRGRLDWPVWLALLLYPIGFLPMLPGALHASAFYRKNFHGKPSLRSFEEPYREIYTSYGWVVVSLLLILAVWLLWRELRNRSGVKEQPAAAGGFTRAEWILAGLLALLPVYEVLAAMVIGVWEYKFCIPFCIGLILVITAGFAEIFRRRAEAGAMALIAVAVCAVAGQGHAVLNGIDELLRPARVSARARAQVMSAPAIQRILESDLPVAMDYFNQSGFDYYGGPKLGQRLYVPIIFTDSDDPKYKFTLTGQQLTTLFARAFPIQTGQIDDFIAQHPHFLVLTEFDMHEWIPIYLLDRQQTKKDLSITLLVSDPSGTLLDVQTK